MEQYMLTMRLVLGTVASLESGLSGVNINGIIFTVIGGVLVSAR